MLATARRPFVVALSFARSRARLAKMIAQGLEGSGVQIYCFLDRADEALGRSLPAELELIFSTAPVVVVLADRQFWLSSYCQLECNAVLHAIRAGKPIKVILAEFEDTEDIRQPDLSVAAAFLVGAERYEEDVADLCIRGALKFI